MRNILLIPYVNAKVLVAILRCEDEGQDLVEYALVAALIALGATFGMNTLANGINSAFVSLAGLLNSYT